VCKFWRSRERVVRFHIYFQGSFLSLGPKRLVEQKFLASCPMKKGDMIPFLLTYGNFSLLKMRIGFVRRENDLLHFWVNEVISAVLTAVVTVALTSRNPLVQKGYQGCAAGGSCNFPLKYHCKMNGSCGTAKQTHILLVAHPQGMCSFLC